MKTDNIITTVVLGMIVTLPLAVALRKPPPRDFNCYIDDTLEFSAVLVRNARCTAGTCTLDFTDATPRLYYNMAEREFCQLETPQ